MELGPGGRPQVPFGISRSLVRRLIHMKMRCDCGEVIELTDMSLHDGSPTWLRHIRDHHPDVWESIENIEQRIHPKTWQEELTTLVAK